MTHSSLGLSLALSHTRAGAYSWPNKLFSLFDFSTFLHVVFFCRRAWLLFNQKRWRVYFDEIIVMAARQPRSISGIVLWSRLLSSSIIILFPNNIGFCNMYMCVCKWCSIYKVLWNWELWCINRNYGDTTSYRRDATIPTFDLWWSNNIPTCAFCGTIVVRSKRNAKKHLVPWIISAA